VITFGSDKRFGLLDSKVRGDNHVTTVGSNKRFGLVDMNIGGDNM
jgi:hypothetical protein